MDRVSGRRRSSCRFVGSMAGWLPLVLWLSLDDGHGTSTAAALTLPSSSCANHHSRLAAAAARSSPPTKLAATFRVNSQPRGRVVLDPKTGFYRPERKEDRESRSPQTSDAEEEGPNAWESFKAMVYQGLDGVASVPKTIQKVVLAKENERFEDEGVYEGHRDVQKRVYAKGAKGGTASSSSSPQTMTTPPLTRLLEEANARRGIVGAENSYAASSTKDSVFDSFKGLVYGTVDLARSEKATSPSTSSNSKNAEVKSETFTPSVKPNFFLSERVQAALPDLQSDNLLKKSVAQWKLEDWQRQQRRRQLERERQELAIKVKETVYIAGDAALATAGSLVKVSAQLSSVVERVARFLIALPDLIKRQMDTVLGLPTQVQQTAKELQTTVQTNVETVQKVVLATVETTHKTVQEVQDLPNKVKKVAQETQSKATAVKEVLDETITTGKVLLGLEQPKPRPPKIPPPPPATPSEVAWSVAGGVTSVVGRTAWWVTKGTVVLAYHGIKFAVVKGVEAIQEEVRAKEMPSLPSTSSSNEMSTTTSSSATTVLPPTPPKSTPPSILTTTTATVTPEVPIKNGFNAKKSVTKAVKWSQPINRKDNDGKTKTKKNAAVNPEIEKQVADALQLAEEALKLAESDEL